MCATPGFTKADILANEFTAELALEMAGTAVPYFGDAVTASFENTGPVIQTVLENIEVMLSDVPDDDIFVMPIAVDDSDTPIDELVVTATSPHIPTNRIGFADGDGR